MTLNSSNTTSIWPSRAPRRPQGGTQEHRNCSKMPPSRTSPSAPRWLSRTVSDPKIALVSSEDGPQNPQDKHSMPQQTFRTLGKSSRWHARSRHSPADREPPPGRNMVQHNHKKALRRLQDCPTPKGGPRVPTMQARWPKRPTDGFKRAQGFAEGSWICIETNCPYLPSCHPAPFHLFSPQTL